MAEEMSPREVLEIMVRTDRGDMTVWSPAGVRAALDAYRDQVLREAGAPQLPAPDDRTDFYRVGHTYRGAYGWRFRVDHITRHPEDGERTALGWRYWDGQWEPYAYGEDDWDVKTAVDEGQGS